MFVTMAIFDSNIEVLNNINTANDIILLSAIICNMVHNVILHIILFYFIQDILYFKVYLMSC